MGLLSSSDPPSDKKRLSSEKKKKKSDSDEEEQPQNLILSIISNLKPGTDLSKVPLPTFILEPRSFLEKMTDFLTHSDLINQASKTDDPLERMVILARWYVSAFYIKPKGLKKPYNPILGEVFKCVYNHTDGTDSQFISEQVSHHPPISAYYVQNKKANWLLNTTISPESRFLGTSASVDLVGTCKLYLNNFEEKIDITLPTIYARGILYKPWTEFGKDVSVVNEKNNLRTDITFKTKPLIGGTYNFLEGHISKIDNPKDILYTIYGKWDESIYIHEGLYKPKKNDTAGEVLWNSEGKEELQQPKTVRKPEDSCIFESHRLWRHVADGITTKDHKKASDEKNRLEEEQRERTKILSEKQETWNPRLFTKNEEGDWIFNRFNMDLSSCEDELEESVHKELLDGKDAVPEFSYIEEWE